MIHPQIKQKNTKPPNPPVSIPLPITVSIPLSIPVSIPLSIPLSIPVSKYKIRNPRKNHSILHTPQPSLLFRPLYFPTLFLSHLPTFLFFHSSPTPLSSSAHYIFQLFSSLIFRPSYFLTLFSYSSLVFRPLYFPTLFLSHLPTFLFSHSFLLQPPPV